MNEDMKDLKPISEEFLDAVDNTDLYPWVKNAIALFRSIDPMFRVAFPWLMAWFIAQCIARVFVP
jgi:hypothetical protein